MSKARAIITAVTVEGISQSEAARRFGVSRGWVSKPMARHRAEGDAAFEPRSRRPHTSPNRLADVVNATIVNLREQLTADGLDAGPHTIQWHLHNEHELDVSVSTIRRRLVAAGLVEPAPKKRPKSSYIRFEAALPNETWQSDFTHIWLADGTDTETITWLDDHSRYALHVSCHRRVTGDIVRDTFDQTAETHGFPASVLTDNGLVYTVRFAGYPGGRNQIETRRERRQVALQRPTRRHRRTPQPQHLDRRRRQQPGTLRSHRQPGQLPRRPQDQGHRRPEARRGSLLTHSRRAGPEPPGPRCVHQRQRRCLRRSPLRLINTSSPHARQTARLEYAEADRGSECDPEHHASSPARFAFGTVEPSRPRP